MYDIQHCFQGQAHSWQIQCVSRRYLVVSDKPCQDPAPTATSATRLDPPKVALLASAASQSILNAIKPASLTVYVKALRQLKRFTLSLPHQPAYLPCSVESMLLFIQHLKGQGLAPASVRSAVAGIGFIHRACQLPNPAVQWVVQRPSF